MSRFYGCFTVIIILILVTDVFCFGSGQISIENLIKSKLSTQTKSCRIPSVPNTVYYQKKPDSEKGDVIVLSPNSAVDGNAAVVHIECHGIARENTSWHGEHYVVCFDGQWYPPNNVCIKLCPVLTPQNSELKCFLRNEPVSCKENIRPQTIAFRTCKSGHIDQSSTSQNICKDNGEWEHKYPDCFLGHGVLSNITGAIASLMPRGG